MKKAIFISVVNEVDIYSKCILENKYIKNSDVIETVCLDNAVENVFISKRYNEFISGYDFSNEVWFIFCHSDWEIKENIAVRLDSLDKDCLYGPIGTIIAENKQKIIKQERRGRIYDRKRDGSNLRLVEYYEIESGSEVDTFDCQCLIVHSSLIKKYNLRFDENLEFDLYVEDFCINAKVSHGIKSMILKIECCHWQQLEDINERPHFFDKIDYINKKYQNYLFGTTILPIGGNGGKKVEKITNGPSIVIPIKDDRSVVYHWDIDLNNVFDARVIALSYIENNAVVLDIGCACGDLGKALKKEKNCTVYGMEYNKSSIEMAEKTGSFEKIYQLDLNNFDINNYSNLEKKVDYIIFGDVLEHVIDPQKTLETFKKLLKKDGFFIISLPNIAHASIKASLLNDEFEYGETGLLDQTHLRFFTYKSIATFLSDIYLEIVDVKFVPLDLHGFFLKDYYVKISDTTKHHIFSDPHSFVCQYVMKISNSDAGRLKIYEKNMNQLDMEKNGIPEHIKNLMANKKIITPEQEIQQKNQEIQAMKMTKAWKLAIYYVYLKKQIKFILLLPMKFVKKYFKL